MELIIEPGRAGRHYARDLWRYRELMYFLAWRDIVVRYKQTALGVAWALLRPALTMVVFVMFRRVLGAEKGGIPEPLLVMAAVLPWQFFSTALSESSASLINNSGLISKVYFPRLIIPCSAVVTCFVDFAITLALLAPLMIWYGFSPTWRLLLLPLFVLLTAALSIGVGVLIAALNVEYRDFRYIVPFVIQFGIFISPVAFVTTAVPEHLQVLFALNPLVGIIDGFRWCILQGQTALDPRLLMLSVAVTAASLVLGMSYFRRMERRFADVI